MKYLLNSAVITSPGDYRYCLATAEAAKSWYNQGSVPISTIGYEQTAIALSQILESNVQVNRTTIQMEPGDTALVFRLVLPPGTPRIDPEDKGRLSQAILDGFYELGLLVRLC